MNETNPWAVAFWLLLLVEVGTLIVLGKMLATYYQRVVMLEELVVAYRKGNVHSTSPDEPRRLADSPWQSFDTAEGPRARKSSG